MGMKFRNANEVDSFRLSAFLSIQWAVLYSARFEMRDLTILADQMHGVARVQHDMNDALSSTLIAEENGLIIAALTTRDSGDGVMRITSLYVEQSVQQQGIASELMEMARFEYGDAWLTYCDVETDNKPAVTFFEKMGLVRSGENRKVELGGKMIEIDVLALCTRSAEEFAQGLADTRKSA